MNQQAPTILIIFGISGDLSKRYLLPAIDAINKLSMAPQEFHIVGVTRQADIGVETLLKKASDSSYLKDHMSLYSMDIADPESYGKLGKYLQEVENKFSSEAQCLFYLSVPPLVAKLVVDLLGKSGLAQKPGAKLLLEKPFGTDLPNAKELVRHIEQHFTHEQVYRVDHYMAKETAQNIIVFREGNSLFKKTWNREFIENIEITVSEDAGIEGRVNFYEQTGALCDMVQSHLLQLAALVLMDLPQNTAEVPILREKALKQLHIVCNIKEEGCVKRGQYEGYRAEVGNIDSMVETFVSINLQSSDPRWKGVPITLTTGKALKSRFTHIKIRYRKGTEQESNELVLRLQPDAGIEFSIWAKVPGYAHRTSPHHLGFQFKDHYSLLPDAYEQVLFNAINSDHRLFTSSGEIVETWRILNDVQTTWKASKEDLIIYKKGSAPEEILSNRQ